jgi:hypothetical protein
MIEHLSHFPDGVLAFVCKGRVTKADYDTVLIPAVVDALKRHPKVRLYYETAPDFTGFDVGAIWDDFSVGMEHIMRWDRVAVVTDVEWVQQATRLFSLILPRSVRIFPRSDTAAARAWIAASSEPFLQKR